MCTDLNEFFCRLMLVGSGFSCLELIYNQVFWLLRLVPFNTLLDLYFSDWVLFSELAVELVLSGIMDF